MRYPTAPASVALAPSAPLPYWQHPDWSAFLAAMREAPGSMTERLVAADFIEESGEFERAAFVRERARLLTLDRADRHFWPVPSRVIKEWFALGELLPNTAQTAGDALNYYSEGTEGDITSPRAILSFFCGFADRLHCDALTLTRAMDDLYAREPVRKVNVFQWASEGADGNPIIRLPMTDSARNVSAFVVGRKVEFKETQFLSRKEILKDNVERAIAECAFEARWPGVEFTVNV